MSIIAFIIIFIFAVFLFGLSLIGNILRAIFGLGRRTYSETKRKQSHTENNKKYAKEQEAASKHKKIIPKNEGEYVDFEEIKD
jgi:Sec-independent protein translocase protein TatA